MKIGSLFTGYGGLDMAVSRVTGGETVWVSDVDKGANKILAHRYPNIPNLGDITAIDFSTVEPVDILTGGFPCQDLSHAGKRAGLKEGTRSGLWSYMADAIEQLKPELVVAENVRGLLSAQAPGVVEPCPWCVGDEPVSDLRALGTVLADLADIGYDARWCGLRAADVGACHGRFRVFLIAFPAKTGSEHRNQWGFTASRQTQSGGPFGELAGRSRTPVDVALLPTPMAAEGTKPSNTMGVARREETGQVMLTNVVVSLAGLDPSEVELLPTPIVSDGKGTSPDDSYNQLRGVHKLFPTPTTQEPRGGESQLDRNTPPLNAVAEFQADTFGDYAHAIHRWENRLGRAAPNPTEPTTGKVDRRRLSPRFVEWMMGLPDGWVTDVPDLSWAEQLKALGNGVVPQQAAAALTHLLGES